MTITAIKEVFGGCMQITGSQGPSFFLRMDYLTCIDPDDIKLEADFTDEAWLDIVNAGFAFAAERAAAAYLGRSEHSRFLLSLKLAKKGHEDFACEAALDYLEKEGSLSDRRFAEAWLRNRLITKPEGAARLAAGLAARGVDRATAAEAIKNLFKMVSAEAVFERALEKHRRLGKSGKKLQDTLLRSGFSSKMIKQISFDKSGF